MKLFIKIMAGVLVFIVLLIVGLNIYFTDERLRSMVLPRISEALDRDVEIDRMSLTVFRSFPQLGLRVEGVMLPDDHGEAVMRLDEMVVAVRLFPLLKNNIDIRRLDLERPQIFYTVYDDATTNMDFLFSDATEETESEYTVQIPRIVIRDAGLVYRDEAGNSIITLENLDAEVGLRFAELIESTIDARLQSLSVMHDGTRYIRNLSLELQQTSTIDLEQEVLSLAEGVFSIRGFAMNLSGSVNRWSSDAPVMDLQFASRSENFGELLRLAPPEYDEYFRELETSGQITLEGNVAGSYSEEALPDFNLTVRVSDGYIKNPDFQEPIQDINFSLLANNQRIDLEQFNALAAGNQFSASGTIDRPFEEDAPISFTVDGDVDLAVVSAYYPLDPWISELTGHAVLNLNAQGPVKEPHQIALNGKLELSEVNAAGDSLDLPVTDLQGVLNLTPDAMVLEGFAMNYGMSDFQIDGRLENYPGFLLEHESEATMPVLSGSYRGRFLNMDEMIDWDEERVDPFPIHLPQMVSTVTAEIDSLLVLGVSFTQLRGNGRINPERIFIDEAEASVFDGKLTGQMTWSVPQPDQTNLRFRGELHDLTAESLFREYPILGENGRFHEYVTGAISADVDYYTEMNALFEPDVESMEASGSFGMTRSRLRDHPVQEQVASWLNIREITNLAIDEWTAAFSINEAVLGFSDFRLTSENIGVELTGTQHLVTDEIDFTAQLLLPGSFRGGIASVISSQAVDALSRDDGIIVVPVRITGTMDNPVISPRQNIIEDIVSEKLQDAGRGVLRDLLNRN